MLFRSVITLLRGYLNSPAVARSEVREAMRRLRQPLTHTAVRELRSAYERFQRDQDIDTLLNPIRQLAYPNDAPTRGSDGEEAGLSREDLHLVCFDFVWS